MARTEIDPGPVEVTPVIGHMTFERRLGIRRPSAKGLLQMVRENVHVAFRLLIAATEAAHAAEPQCESGDVRASQHVAACLDVTVLGIQDESPGICHAQETHRQHHARTGHDERVRARTVRTAQDAGRRGQAREPAGPRVRRIRPAHASGGRSYLCPRRRRLGVRVSAGRPGGQGHRRPFRRAGPGTQAWYWARSPPSTSR